MNFSRIQLNSGFGIVAICPAKEHPRYLLSTTSTHLRSPGGGAEGTAIAWSFCCCYSCQTFPSITCMFSLGPGGRNSSTQDHHLEVSRLALEHQSAQLSIPPTSCRHFDVNSSAWAVEAKSNQVSPLRPCAAATSKGSGFAEAVVTEASGGRGLCAGLGNCQKGSHFVARGLQFLSATLCARACLWKVRAQQGAHILARACCCHTPLTQDYLDSPRS